MMSEAALYPIKSASSYGEAAAPDINNDSEHTNSMPDDLNIENVDKSNEACNVPANTNDMSLEQVGSIDGAVPEVGSTDESSETTFYPINGK